MHSPVNAAARLDRLPLGPLHRRVLRLVGMGMFFDSFDIAMMAGVLAALVASGMSDMSLNASFISATFLGLTIGAALAGVLGDRLGRRFAYQFNLLIFGSACLAASLAPSMNWLIVIRCIMGIGLGAEFVVGYGMISEFVPPGQRGRYTALLNLISSSGVFAVSLIGFAVIPWLGWRAMFVIGGVGALWVWWLRRSLPESPRWLESVGRTDEAEQVLRRIEREAANGRALPPVIAVPAPPSGRVPISVLFSRPVVRRTLLAMAVNVTCLVGSYSFTAWIPSFFVRQGFSVTRSLGFTVAMMAGTIAGPALAVLLADRIGRRRGIMAAGISCATIGSIYPFLADPIAIMLCGFLLVSSMSLFLALGLGGYTPELFPTAYRFRGSGIAQMTGRAALIASPYFVVALYDGYGITGVAGVIAGMYLALVCIVALAGIETNQKSLEALAPEAEPVAAALAPAVVRDWHGDTAHGQHTTRADVGSARHQGLR
jgi:MFS transporter, putative metabolite:H+ symporter